MAINTTSLTHVLLVASLLATVHVLFIFHLFIFLDKKNLLDILISFKMEDPNADTQWNDVLRQKGILPPKQTKDEFTEDDIINLVDATVEEKIYSGKTLECLTLDELDELEDEEDERVILQYRQKRIAEMKAQLKLDKFSDVRDISAEDYVNEVNKAGDGVWVVLHLYKSGIPLCTLINQYLVILAKKFPATKFLRSISTVCVPNFPDKNLPTIFVYHEGQSIKQILGPLEFGGMNLTIEGLEWILADTGAFKTDLETDPRSKTKIRDVLFSSLRSENDSDDENDW